MGTYVQFNDPEQGDEKEVKCDEEAESAANIRDGLPLSWRGGQVVGRREGQRGL